MKYFGLLLVSIVLVKCAPEIRSADDITTFVMGGSEAGLRQFPSAVYINVSDSALPCGGTIVHAQHVVTAASCLIRHVNNRPEVIHSRLIRIIGGDLNYLIPTYGRVIRHVSNIFVHPDFDYHSKEDDIAVLRLSEPFSFPDNFIETAVRRQRIVPQNQICEFAGWGRVSATGSILLNINMLSFQIQLHEACNTPALYLGGVLESMICASAVGGAGLCYGNEGSGLYCNNEFTGVVSFGIDCGLPVAIRRPGVFTQVRFFNDWLDQQFVRNDTPEVSIW